MSRDSRTGVRRLLFTVVAWCLVALTSIVTVAGIEKRRALDFWGKRVDQIVSGKRGNVLAFVARA